MPGLSLIFWLTIALFFGAACAVCIGLLLLGRRRKSRFLKWAGGVPLMILTGLLLLLVGAIVKDRIRMAMPRFVFEDELGRPPPASVTGLQSEVNPGWDSRTVHLKFHCPPEELSKLIPDRLRRLKVREYTSYECIKPDTPHPDWWTVDLKADLEVHGLQEEQGTHLFEERILIHDPSSGVVHYYATWID
jgi:hypothetical protein